MPQRQRRGIARQGTLVGFLARRAAAYEETAAAIVFVIAVEVRNAPDLPGTRIVPAIEFAADHDPCADTRAERHAHHVAICARLAEAADAQSKAIAVVVDIYGDTEPFFEQVFEVYLAPRRDAYDIVDDPARRIHDRRHADTDAGDVGGDELPDERGNLIHDLPFGAVGFAGFGEQPHDAAILHQAGAHVRAA